MQAALVLTLHQVSEVPFLFVSSKEEIPGLGSLADVITSVGMVGSCGIGIPASVSSPGRTGHYGPPTPPPPGIYDT